MSLYQQKKLRELGVIFSEGKASPKQIQELSALLAQLNQISEYETHYASRDIDLKNNLP